MSIRSLPQILGLVVLVCVGCVTDIKTSEIAPLVQSVTERHNAYAEASVSPEKTTWIVESTALDVLVEENEKIRPDTLRLFFEPVASRHDEWVSGDTELAGYKARTALRSTAIIRSFYSEDD